MKKFSLLVIMVLWLLLIGCGNKQTTEENNIEESINEVTVNEESDFNKSDCIKWCEMISNKEWMLQDCEALCDAWEAMETNNADGCENSEWMLRDSCYSSIAYETANPKLCEKLTDGLLEYGCYTSIAEKTKDISICDKIDDKTWKMSCEIWARSE